MGIETAILGGAALSAGAGIWGSSKASKAQQQAAQQAQAFQQQMLEQARNALTPYMNLGTGAAGQLQDRMGYFTSPIAMLDQAGLENLPGYQFTREQGMKGVQASAAARGLGNSGAAMKDIARFTTGLADQTYGNQFQRYFDLERANRQDPYARLMGVAQMGQGAAGTFANALMGTGQNVGNALIGAGNAQAGGYMGMANAVGNFGNSISQYQMMAPFMQNQALQNQLLQRQVGMYG